MAQQQSVKLHYAKRPRVSTYHIVAKTNIYIWEHIVIFKKILYIYIIFFAFHRLMTRQRSYVAEEREKLLVLLLLLLLLSSLVVLLVVLLRGL